MNKNEFFWGGFFKLKNKNLTDLHDMKYAMHLSLTSYPNDSELERK